MLGLVGFGSFLARLFAFGRLRTLCFGDRLFGFGLLGRSLRSSLLRGSLNFLRNLLDGLNFLDNFLGCLRLNGFDRLGFRFLNGLNRFGGRLLGNCLFDSLSRSFLRYLLGDFSRFHCLDSRGRRCFSGWLRTIDARSVNVLQLDTSDQMAEDIVRNPVDAVEFLCDGGFGLEEHEDVESFAAALDFVCQSPLVPAPNRTDFSALVGNELGILGDDGIYLFVGQSDIDDVH